MKMCRVIIIGADHPNVLGMVRSLGSRGVYPDVYVIKHDVDVPLVTVRSKYIKSVHIFESEQAMLDCLKQDCCSNNNEKSILLLGSDKACSCIDENWDALKGGYVFFNAKGNLTSLMNKETMSHLASKIGLNVPPHILLNTTNKENIKQLLDEEDNLSFPCITKAISSLAGNKSDTTICLNKEELVSFLKSPNLCHTIQIEKFIEKEIEFQFIGLSLDGGDTIIIPGHTNIDRPNGIQNVFSFPYIENDASFNTTLELTKAFIRKTGYTGLFSVEFLRGKDGHDYFLEMNFRNDGNAICVTNAGYNLPYIWYLYASGQDYSDEINKSILKPVYYCPEYVSLYLCAFGELSIMKWLHDLFKATSFREYYKGDSPMFWPKYAARSIQWMIRKFLLKMNLWKAPQAMLDNLGIRS